MRLTSVCLLLAAPALLAQEGRLTLEAVAHPTKRVAFAKPMLAPLTWLPDGSLLRMERTGKQITLQREDAATGARAPWLDSDRLIAALVAAGAPEKQALAVLGRGAVSWNKTHTGFLVSVADDLYLVDEVHRTAKRLTQATGREDEATFSPDGTQVAFLRGNDLYRVDPATGTEVRLTTGGGETVFNGRLDWVYQEEVYGRGHFKAYWWAPDSKHLAFLSLDETKVPVYRLEDDRNQTQKTLAARYPRAGEPNPVARLGVVDLDGHAAWMTDPYPGQDTLIVQVGWDPQGRLLASYQDRIQRWLDLRRFEGSTSRALLHEQGPAWQERLPLPTFLKDGGFLWTSDRTGHRHLYRYDAQARLEIGRAHV